MNAARQVSFVETIAKQRSRTRIYSLLFDKIVKNSATANVDESI
jgi:hypothetical protein